MANYENDIFARLQAGESVESIAKELTENLNKANAQYKAEQEAAKRKAQAEAEAKQSKALKIEAINFLIDAFIEVSNAWGLDDAIDTLFTDLDAEEIVEDIDKAMPVIKQYVELQKSMSNLFDKSPEAQNDVDNTPLKMTAEDPIERFLNTFVR